MLWDVLALELYGFGALGLFGFFCFLAFLNDLELFLLWGFGAVGL